MIPLAYLNHFRKEHMKSRIHWAALGLLAAFAAQAETVTIEHRLGKTTLEQKPQRVVVIGVGALDAIDSFGIEPLPFPNLMVLLTILPNTRVISIQVQVRCLSQILKRFIPKNRI